MKKIAITGGKGGTGKSTYAVLMASRLFRKDRRVLLIDADAECPNLHLLLGVGIGKVLERVFADFPKLDKKKCTKCGLCAKTCKENAIFQAPGKYPIFFRDLCSACGACMIVCPEGAIKPQKEEIGKIYFQKIKDNFFLLTGLAKAGLEETGPVVGKLKEVALKIAKKEKADFVIIDTAAGTHCPVINALMDIDIAYAVTEPTPMGAYDLHLILDLMEKLKIKKEVVLNQADLGDKKLLNKVLADFKIKKFFEEIPHSRKLAKAYSAGELLNFNL